MTAPNCRKGTRQLELDPRIIDRDVRRQDQRVAVALLPKAVNHCGHEAQHAARALELHQRRPIGVEPIEDLRMDWIGGLEPLFVVGIAALRREFLMLRSVEVREGARHHVAIFELRRVGHRLEQPSPHNLESFLGAGRPPRRFDAADNIAEPIKRFASALAAYLDVVRLSCEATPTYPRREG